LGISQIRKTIPYFLNKRTNKSIFLFDAWAPQFDRITYTINKYNINNVFVTSLDAAKELQVRVPQAKIKWIPEAIDPKDYYYLANDKKDIDILSFGRKHPLYHSFLLEYTMENDIKYLYELPDELVFKDQNEFYKGLARSRISVCFLPI